MNKNLLWILLNILILSLGILVGSFNERINITEVTDNFLTPLIDDYNTLNQDELEIKYSRYLDYINIAYDDLYLELATSQEYVVNEGLFTYSVYLSPNGEYTEDSYTFDVSIYLGGAFPYDYLFVGIITVINMFGLVLLQTSKKYYLHNFIDIATFITVMLLLFFMNSDYGIDTYILIVILHSFILIFNYLIMVLTNQYRYVIRPEEKEVKKLQDLIDRRKIHFEIKKRNAIQGSNYQAVVKKQEIAGLFKTLDDVITPYDKKYIRTNFIVIGVLAVLGAVVFIINLW